MLDISGNISPSLTSHSSLSQKFHPSPFTLHSSLKEALAETRFRLDSLHLVVVEN